MAKSTPAGNEPTGMKFLNDIIKTNGPLPEDLTTEGKKEWLSERITDRFLEEYKISIPPMEDRNDFIEKMFSDQLWDEWIWEKFKDPADFDKLINQTIHSQTNTIMENSKKEIKVTGNLGNYEGKTHDYKFFDESQKSTISFTIRTPDKGKGKEGEWVHVRAYNTKAERLKKAIEVEGIKTFTLSGSTKLVEYESKKTPGKQVKYDELQVNNIVLHKTLEIKGTIAKSEKKETSTGKAFTEILVIDESVKKEGGATKDLYNVTIWPEKQKFIPSDVKLEKGEKVAVIGRANILENQSGSEQYITIEARNVDKTPARLQTQIKDLQAKAEEKKAAKGAEIDKPKKAKGKGQEIER